MTDDELTVRPMDPGDRDAVRQLHERCFDAELAFDDLVLQRLFRHHHVINLVALLAGRTVGYAAAIHGQRPTARLLTIQSDPGARGRGVAQALLDELEERLRARGAKRLQLEVHVGNHAAISLYEKRGFETVREDPTSYPSLEEPAGYVMEKAL